MPYAFLPVRPSAVARAVPDHAALRSATRGIVGLTVVAFDAATTNAHVRTLAPRRRRDRRVACGPSICTEDPATGSAAVARAVFLVDRGVLDADGQTGFTVAQGAEIGRPSQLQVLVEAVDGTATRTAVCGSVAAVARGELVAGGGRLDRPQGRRGPPGRPGMESCGSSGSAAHLGRNPDVAVQEVLVVVLALLVGAFQIVAGVGQFVADPKIEYVATAAVLVGFGLLAAFGVVVRSRPAAGAGRGRRSARRPRLRAG